MNRPIISETFRDDLPRRPERTLVDIALLEDQPLSAVRALEDICHWCSYADGNRIFDRTAAGSSIYFIVKGKCRVISQEVSGHEATFVDHDAGEHFGDLSVIDGEPRETMAYALEDSILAEVSGEEFRTYLREHPEVASRLMQHFVRAIRSLNERVAGLSAMTTTQKVYGELMQMAEPHPWNPRKWIINTMPRHKEVAKAIGTTPETVAKSIGRLLEAQIVKRRNNTLHILDRRRLQELTTAT